MGLNSEGVDESQFLPKEFNQKTGKHEQIPPVNAYRAQHGNIKWAGESIKDANWLPEIVFDGDNDKEKPYLDTAKSFFKILVQAKRTLGITDLRGPLFDKLPYSANPETDMFVEIHRGLAKPEMTAVIWFVWDDYNRCNVALAHKIIGTIKHGLENVQKILDSRKKDVDNSSGMRDTYLSAAPELRPKFPVTPV